MSTAVWQNIADFKKIFSKIFISNRVPIFPNLEMFSVREMAQIQVSQDRNVAAFSLKVLPIYFGIAVLNSNAMHDDMLMMRLDAS